MIFVLDRKPLDKAASNVGKAAEKLVPEALKEALTVVALRARKAERANVEKNLDRPKPFTISSIAARRARIVNGELESAVFVLPRMAQILSRLEDGGVLDQGLQIVDKKLENKYGSLPRSRFPDRLLKRKNTFRGKINGVDGIWQRQKGALARDSKSGRFKSTASNRLKLLIAFVDRPRYRAILGFEKVAEQAGSTFQAEAIRQLDNRLRRIGMN